MERDSGRASQAIRTLGVLLVLWVVLELVSGVWYAHALSLKTILTVIVQGLILTALFYRVRDGSRGARIVLTVYAIFQSVLLLVVVVKFVIPQLFAIDLVKLGIRVAVLVFVNSTELTSLRPRPRTIAPPSVADHEHRWEPDELLNDWVRCAICKEFYMQPGTIALVNRRKKSV
jgi:hypothetical protein